MAVCLAAARLPRNRSPREPIMERVGLSRFVLAGSLFSQECRRSARIPNCPRRFDSISPRSSLQSTLKRRRAMALQSSGLRTLRPGLFSRASRGGWRAAKTACRRQPARASGARGAPLGKRSASVDSQKLASAVQIPTLKHGVNPLKTVLTL